MSTSHYAKFVLAGLLILAFLLRVYRVDTYGIFFDEKSTLLISQGVCLEGANQKDVFTKPYFTPAEFWAPKTFADFIEANTRGDIGNSPAYYGVLWLWMEVFGLSDFSMRMPSVLFSTLTVLLLYIFVKRHIRAGSPGRTEAVALISCTLAAIEPFFVSYSHMARNYSMTFLLTLLATHLFLLIMERSQKRLRLAGSTTTLFDTNWLYAAYGLTFALSTLSHYLTVIVFACHGLYMLLYLRNTRMWVTMALAGIIGFIPVVLWFTIGGGQDTFFTLNYQATLYRHVALTNPINNPYGLILPATLPNIMQRIVPIFSDLFMVTNGMGLLLTSIRNTVPALAAGFAVTVLIERFGRMTNPPLWIKLSVAGIMILSLLVYSAAPLRFMALSTVVPLIYLCWIYARQSADSASKRLMVLLILLTFIPTFFLIVMAWRSGHTFGLTQRYSGFSFPYAIILIAISLLQLASLRWWFSAPLWIGLAIQLTSIVQLLGKIYDDNEPKYTYFGKPRMANPYWTAAQRLISQYQPGDTILYPNRTRVIEAKFDIGFTPVALLDAQLVNVYLPTTAQYVQRVDPAEPNKIVLRKGNTGQRITIFDLKGKTFRY